MSFFFFFFFTLFKYKFIYFNWSNCNYFTILHWFCHTSTWILHGCTLTSFLKDMSLCLERVRESGTDSFYLSFWLAVKLRNLFGVQMFHIISKTMAEVGSTKWKFIKLYYYYKWKYFVKLEKNYRKFCIWCDYRSRVVGWDYPGQLPYM